MFTRKMSLAIAITISSLALIGGIAYFGTRPAHAIDMKNFDPGNIMDDVVFYDSGSMNATQIQQFLNSKMPTCDTQGSQPYLNTGKTVKQYWTPLGEPGPYTCLKDYKQQTPAINGSESGICSYTPGYSSRTAAQIINDVAKSCGISPKVLLVLLQKEQSLVTDNSPLARQYKEATGMGCPDTAACDPKYNGFFNQVYGAARQYKLYRANPNNYNYVAGRNNFVQYNPNASCGGSTIYIKNQATAGLYNYTPYQPNEATKKVGIGVTAPCGAYGNKNFWWVFTSWFGSTLGSVAVNGITIESQPFLDNTITASFSIKNNTTSRINFGLIKIAVRSPSNKNVDFDYIDNLSLSPGQSYVYSKARSFSSEEGDYRFFIARYDGTNWHYPPFGNFGQSSDGEVTRRITKSPVVSEQLSLNASGGIHNTQSVTASFKIRNPSVYPVDLGITQVAVRDSKNKNLDFLNDGSKTLAPGETYIYQKTRTIEGAGSVRAWIANVRDTYNWSDTFPVSETSGMKREIVLPVKDTVTLTSPLDITMPNPVAGSQATATFKLKNHGTVPVEIGIIKPAVRDSKNTNLDFPNSPYVVLEPGQEYAYNHSRILPSADNLRIWIANKRDAYPWSDTFPVSETSGMKRETRYNLQAMARLIAPLSVSVNGRTISATFSVKNFSARPVEIGIIKPAVRDSKNTNLDFPNSPYVVLAPGQIYTYAESRTMPSAAQLKIWIADKRNAYPWSDTFPVSQDSSMLRQTTVNIN